jgi:hypothetical protein
LLVLGTIGILDTFAVHSEFCIVAVPPQTCHPMTNRPLSHPLSVRVKHALVAVSLYCAAFAVQAQDFPLDALPPGAVARDVVASAAHIGSRKAVRIELSEEALRPGLLGRLRYVDEPTYLALPIDFTNGTIKVDLYGKLNGKGSRDARAFIGIAFRTGPDHQNFEAVYFRPTNGRKAQPGSPRDKRAVQYFSYPDWKFDRLRKDFPDGRYESGADITDNEWFAARLEIEGARVKVYVNDKLELVVNDMRLGAARQGGIGLWVDIGTEGYFSNLQVLKK